MHTSSFAFAMLVLCSGAAHAAALTTGPVQQGATAVAAPLAGGSMSQTADTAPVASNSVACNVGGVTTANDYYRRFYFSETGATGPAHITSVDVGVESSSGQSIVVNLYSIPHAVAVDTIDMTQLTLLGTGSAAVPAGTSLSSVNVPVSGAIADTVGNDLVVDVSTPDGRTDNSGFFIGSTPAAETHPGFLMAPDCGITAPSATAAVGQPNMHIILVVNGSGLPVELQSYSID